MKKNILITIFLLLLFFFNSIKVIASPLEVDNNLIFDAQFYSDTYPDLKDAFGYDTKLLYNHYLTFGINEGRIAFEENFEDDVFNYKIIGNCKNVETMDNFINNIPEKLKSFLFNNNWTIYLTGEKLAITEFNGKYSSVMGCTNYSLKYIKIEDREEAINKSVLHEIGHAIDYNTGVSLYSSNEGFLNFYNTEKNNLLKLEGVTKHSISNSAEYFAESIQQYILNPNELEKFCPKTFLYIKIIVDNI